MKLLLVEDERPLAALLQRRLAGEGFSVDVRDNGPDGLEALLQTSPDVAVVDVMLPGFDGVSLTIQARQAGSTTPVLLLTARNEVPDRVVGLDAGADD